MADKFTFAVGLRVWFVTPSWRCSSLDCDRLYPWNKHLRLNTGGLVSCQEGRAYF